MAIRLLCTVPYESDHILVPEFLPLWHDVMEQWASSSSWYGLHGHLFLGRLAAVNTLIHIRQYAQLKELKLDFTIHSSRGALASEYYSIGKQIPSFLFKRFLLNKALWNVNKALQDERMDPSGLLGIRGSVLILLGHFRQAVTSYTEMLKIRQQAEEDQGGIGEAEVDLGFSYLFNGRLWKGRALMETGVERLEHANRSEFLVKSLKKLCISYALTGRYRESLRILERVCILFCVNGNSM